MKYLRTILLLCALGIPTQAGLNVVCSLQTDRTLHMTAVKDQRLFGIMGTMLVYDISAPAAPVRLPILDTAFGVGEGLFIRDTIAYIAGSGRLKIWSIANINAPYHLATSQAIKFDPPIWPLAHKVAVSGNTALLANCRGGLQLFDITNPRNPIHKYNLAQVNDDVDKIFVRGDTLFMKDHALGLFLVDIARPDSPVIISQIDTLHGTDGGVWAENDLVYSACGGNGIRILSIKDPVRPVLVGIFKCGNAHDVVVRNGVAYVADEFRGLIEVDVSNPAAPKQLSIIPGFKPTAVTLDGELIIASSAVQKVIVIAKSSGLVLSSGTASIVPGSIRLQAKGRVLSVLMPGPANAMLSIVNINGQCVSRTDLLPMGSGMNRFSFPGLRTGRYVVSVRMGREGVFVKWIVE